MSNATGPHHDHSYKRLFSHKEMIRDLLVGFVREDWVQSLDWDSLETVKGSFVTDDFREREDDIIWRVRWADQWLYVYLLIEFQSSVDRFMAVRIANYLTLLYQDLIEQQQLTRNGRLPPVLPIVLYNGNPRWQAEQNLHDLIEPVPGGLERYRPRMEYLLLDEGAIVHNELYPLEVRNLVAALFQMEHTRDEATWLDLYQRLVAVLDSEALDSLKRAFGRWIYKSYILRKRPGIELPDINDFQEVHAMLQERVEKWNQEIREKGRQEGLQEGLQEGRQEGLQKGLQKGLRETALAMIQRTQLDDATIVDLTGLPLAEVQALRNRPTEH